MPTRIISGGQTGVDRAALDVALELGLPLGGWCPRGRRAEDGVLPAHYPLTETPTDIYAERTEKNVLESDGTLVLIHGPATGGTRLTIDLAERHRRPCLVIDLAADVDPELIREWIRKNAIGTLNVAGPRESTLPGIYEQARSIIRRVLI